MGTPAYLRSKYAPAAGGMPRSGEAAVTSVESTFPKIRSTRWSGQRDVRVFASQIRTGFRRLRLLATNASRLLYARTLAGSSPGALLKKARHRDGAVLVLLTGAGNGTRTRECQLGKLMPYHLAMPAIAHWDKLNAWIVYTEHFKGAI